jgi:hypothetical protein
VQVVIDESDTGFRLAFRGSVLAVVDTTLSIVEILTNHGSQRRFGVSIAGVAAAAEVLQNICAFHVGAVVGGVGASPDFRTLLLAALRRSAAARLPDIGRVEQAVAAERETPLVLSRAVVDAPYFVADVLRYRGAAVAAAHIEDLVTGTERVDVVDSLRQRLERWPTLFAPHGRVNRAVHKTLADLSDQVSGDDLWALSGVRLERPVKSALHLRILAERARTAGKNRQEHLSMIQHAEHDELVELRSRVADALELEDASEAEGNHLLAEAIANGGSREHNERLGRIVERSLIDGPAIGRVFGTPQPGKRALAPSTPTALPPIEPPEGARLLRTVGEIVREGVAMRHCVGTHAAGAVLGHSFVFHIDLDGEPVTVEVDAQGYIVDCAGFANDRTGAAQKARAIFEAWGERFR